jgi:hypothetical protein
MAVSMKNAVSWKNHTASYPRRRHYSFSYISFIICYLSPHKDYYDMLLLDFAVLSWLSRYHFVLYEASIFCSSHISSSRPLVHGFDGLCSRMAVVILLGRFELAYCGFRFQCCCLDPVCLWCLRLYLFKCELRVCVFHYSNNCAVVNRCYVCFGFGLIIRVLYFFSVSCLSFYLIFGWLLVRIVDQVLCNSSVLTPSPV